MSKRRKRALVSFFVWAALICLWVSSCRSQSLSESGLMAFQRCAAVHGWEFCCTMSPAALDGEEGCPEEMARKLYGYPWKEEDAREQSTSSTEMVDLVRSSSQYLDPRSIPVGDEGSASVLDLGVLVWRLRHLQPVCMWTLHVEASATILQRGASSRIEN